MKFLRFIALALGLLAPFLLSTPIYADMPNPDSVTIDDIFVNTYLLESGDMLIYFTPNVAYATGPDYSIDNAFDFRLISTDNVNVLASRDAYNFVDDGYGPNILSFYFTAADAPTWGESYTIRISGKPTVFDDPPVYNFSITSGDYTSETTQEANQDEVQQNILDIATDLTISMVVELLEETDVGTVLSSYGEELFRNTIPGLQAMVPELFQVIIYQPDYDPRTWTSELSENYTSTANVTAEGGAASTFWGNMLGLNFSLGVGIPIIAGCALFIIASHKSTNQPYSGFLNSSAAIVIASPAGWIPMAIVSIGALLLSFYSSVRVFLKG